MLDLEHQDLLIESARAIAAHPQSEEQRRIAVEACMEAERMYKAKEITQDTKNQIYFILLGS